MININNRGHCGYCAKCGSNNIGYEAQELVDNDICYPYECRDCSHTGKEWYHLEYIESE